MNEVRVHERERETHNFYEMLSWIGASERERWEEEISLLGYCFTPGKLIALPCLEWTVGGCIFEILKISHCK